MSPVVLGIDTSAQWCSAALLRGPEVFTRRAEVGNAHSNHLLPMVEAVLAEAGVSLDACDAIAFGAGPGSFTGLRIACAVAQGLAFGASIQVAPIDTLEAIAHSLRATDEASGLPRADTVLVAQDARMGQVYWALFEQAGESWHTLAVPGLSHPSRLREALGAVAGSRHIDVGCGNAWAVYGDAMDGVVPRVVGRAAADAAEIATLGVITWREGRLVPPDLAAPIYVRDDVAQTTAQRDAAARGRSGAVNPVRSTATGR